MDEEVDKLGGVPPNAKKDSAEFEAIKREVLALPVVKKGAAATAGGASGPVGPPPAPSRNSAKYQASGYRFQYPDNWRKYGENGSKNVSFAPDGGILQGNGGQGGLAYGIIVDVTAVQGDPNSADALENETQQLVANLEKENPNMRVTRGPGRVRLNGQPGLSTYFSNDSPAGGQETDWLITVIRPEGLVSFVCVAPEKDYAKYDKTFSAILDSVRFSN